MNTVGRVATPRPGGKNLLVFVVAVQACLDKCWVWDQGCMVVLVHAQCVYVFVVICEVKRVQIMCSIQIQVELVGVWVEGRVVHTGSDTLSNHN